VESYLEVSALAVDRNSPIQRRHRERGDQDPGQEAWVVYLIMASSFPT
jgi:hypothetical protein